MCARHLRAVSENRIGSKLTDAHEQLCLRAEEWADEVVAVTAGIQRSVGGALASEEPQ